VGEGAGVSVGVGVLVGAIVPVGVGAAARVPVGLGVGGSTPGGGPPGKARGEHAASITSAARQMDNFESECGIAGVILAPFYLYSI
jgi:hypothetical protein